MQVALEEAHRAASLGEVPVGAAVVAHGHVIARACNRPIGLHDPTAHAEMLAMREAGQVLGNYRLTGTTVYVTVEPCLMCVGALVLARVGTVVFGATEPKTGALVSAVRALDLPGLNHRFEVVGGVCEKASRELMQQFFQQRRGG